MVKPNARSRVANDWLSVVESLDKLIADRASIESTETKKPSIHRNTLELVNMAYAVTLRYYNALLGGGQRDSRTQLEISKFWQRAGAGIKRHDPVLANQLKASNGFWSNEVTWAKETIQAACAGLNSVRANINKLAFSANSI